MSKITEIIEESLVDGNGVLVHKENFKWLIEQAEKLQRFQKYVLYFAGKDRLNDIRMAMEENELD